MGHETVAFKEHEQKAGIGELSVAPNGSNVGVERRCRSTPRELADCGNVTVAKRSQRDDK